VEGDFPDNSLRQLLNLPYSCLPPNLPLNHPTRLPSPNDLRIEK
jgi:hypothetical protein